MPFESIGPVPLDAIVNVRLTSSEKERLRKDADTAGVSMSELVRRRYFGMPLVAHADEIMLKELRRVGGLLKHVHTESNGAYSIDTAKAISDITIYMQSITKK